LKYFESMMSMTPLDSIYAEIAAIWNQPIQEGKDSLALVMRVNLSKITHSIE